MDQQGVVRYLRSEYDPQTMLNIVNQLVPTKIEEGSQDQSLSQQLHLKLYPNPSNSQTTVQFEVSSAREIILKLYDLNGRVVLAEKMKAGNIGEVQNVNLDLESTSSGIYFISVRNGEYSEVKKLVLTK